MQSRFTTPSAATVADLLIRFLVAEHTGVSIVKTDFAELSRFPNLPVRKRPARELAFNVTPDDSEFRACLLATWRLDVGELEETSIGNYSGHALTASQLRTNAANAI